MTARAYKEYMDYCEITQGYYNTGKEDGRAEGRTEAKLEAARNMLMKNAPEDMIVRCTALPLETVHQLAEELKIKA